MQTCQQQSSIQSGTSPVIGQPHVYVLPTHNRARTKIGRSVDPFGRIAGLIRNHPEIDLDRAVIIGVDSLSVEKVLHTVFESSRNPLPQRIDGYTEWFDGDFVERVVALCQTVAECRGSAIAVTRNLAEGLRTYLQRHGTHSLPVPRLSKIEREARTRVLMERLSELVVDHTQYFIDVMRERSLTHVQDRVGRHYLCRQINISDELVGAPENGVRRVTVWGERLYAAGDVSVAADGCRAIFHLVHSPLYQRIDQDTFREYFRISQGPDEPPLHSATDVSIRAFELLWTAVQQLAENSDGRSE